MNRPKGAAGVGLSAHVRSAYGFLVDNYDEGDKIYFFGFSRGAYTARAIAGLVVEMGLLTSRGMDNFTSVYNAFYSPDFKGFSAEEKAQLGFRPPLPRFTVQIIGVWDTVGFHKTWLGKALGAGEQMEFRNTLLHPDVKYAFHALSLDEDRTAFQPTLWHLTEPNEGQEMIQVWFSGGHADVGGGATDPRLSNIPLAWMISQCSKDNQLTFDVPGYLFDHNPPKPQEAESVPWATSKGKIAVPWNFSMWLESKLGGVSKRTPLAYKPKGVPHAKITNEFIHVSIKDRNCARQVSALSFPAWPCASLRARKNQDVLALTDGREIHQVQASKSELYMKGRIRKVHVEMPDDAQPPEGVDEGNYGGKHARVTEDAAV